MNEPVASSNALIDDAGTGNRRHGWRRWLNLNTFGLVLLLGVTGWSLLRIATNQAKLNDPTLKYVRICHWQLESGFREALQAVIDDYNTLHADQKVKVMQMAVTEKIYPQWLNVNLIAGNAPDIAQLGGQIKQAGGTADAVARNFLPLGREILKPNPYNAPKYLDEIDPLLDTPALRQRLAEGSWRETLTDGMRGGWRQDLQDYYGISTAFFTSRLACNMTLLKEATGRDEPPRTLGEMLVACERLRAWGKEQGKTIDPIASASYHPGMFFGSFASGFLYRLQDRLDRNLDGQVTSMESWAALQDGLVKLDEPMIAAYYALCLKIVAQFNPNYTAMDRDQALAAFVAGRSAFLAAASWDAGSIASACKNRVDYRLMTFPLPAADEPEAFGELGTVYGQSIGFSEASGSGGATFGITKTAQYPDIALDFLRFLSSHKYNQRFAIRNGWLPITVGSLPADHMRIYMPNPYGVSSGFNADNGGDLEIFMEGKRRLFLNSEISYQDVVDTVTAKLNDPGIGVDNLWLSSYTSIRGEERSIERTIAVQSWRELVGKGQPDTPDRVREILVDQTLRNHGNGVKLEFSKRNPNRSFPPEGK